MRVQRVHYAAAIVATSGGLTSAVRILQGNDDGWAEDFVRSFNNVLNQAGHDVVLSCPADNKSGSSSLDFPPTPRKDPCQYDSCPANSGPVGTDLNDRRLNWVNSYPVTGVRYGIDTFGPQIWDGAKPDLVVTGPNVGSNVWWQIQFSGTVGGAVFAAKDRKIPSIAFSADSDATRSFADGPPSAEGLVYASLAANITSAVLASGTPYLPENVFLNVNFPAAEGPCADARNFRFVYARVNPRIPFITPDDAEVCGTKALPNDQEVLDTGRDRGLCLVSVSPGSALDKTTADPEDQVTVYNKLKAILSCLPN